MVTEKSKVCRTVYMIFCYLNKNGWGKINIQVFACMCTAYLWEDTQEMELGVSRKRNWRRENRSGKQVILLYLKNPLKIKLCYPLKIKLCHCFTYSKSKWSHKEQKQNKPCSQDKLPRFWPSSPCLTLQSYIKPPSLSLSFSLCLSLCLSLYLSVAQSPSHTCTCMCTGFFLNF